MFEKLNTIELSGEKYPIKCDMVVLEQIQKEYGDIGSYEKKIITLKAKENEDGTEEYESVIPDIKALSDGLYWMISEGLEIEGKEPVERKDLLRRVDKTMFQLSREVHGEFLKCFVSEKNEETTQI